MTLKDDRRIVEQYIDAWRENDQVRLGRLVDEDARFVGQPQGYGGDREGFLQLTRDYHNAFSDVSMEADHWVEGEEGRVAVHIKGSGKHTGDFLGVAATGNPVEAEGLMLVTVRDGKIVEDITEIDAMRMLDQMGALPELGAATE